MDAIKLLKEDHRQVEALFRRFEGAKAARQKWAIAHQLVKLLAVHTRIEEELLYPAARELSEELREQVLEALEEHHLAKATLVELDWMSAGDERFEAKVTVLIENVRHHLREEEGELFPTLRKLMSSAQLEALGAAMKQAKGTAPDSPLGNFISSVLAQIVESARDLVRTATRGVSRA